MRAAIEPSPSPLMPPLAPVRSFAQVTTNRSPVRVTTSGKPIVLRVETKAGHGMGKPTAKVADQLACELAFIEEETNA